MMTRTREIVGLTYLCIQNWALQLYVRTHTNAYSPHAINDKTMLSIHVYCCIKFNVLVISSFCTTLRYKEVDFTEKLYSQNYVSISSECFRCERYSTVLLNSIYKFRLGISH